MRIHQTARGFVIVRGVRNKQFFGFFVDANKTSWTKKEYGARVYALRDSAVEDIHEINLRRGRKTNQVEYPDG